MTTSLEILYYQECSNESESNASSTIDIVVGGEHGQRKFRSICNFILRYINVKNLNSYVIKNVHIDCEKNAYVVWNKSIMNPLNDEIKIIMNEDMCFLMWNENKKVILKYSKSEDINESNFRSVIRIRTGVLISGDQAYFATVVGKIDMSNCWYH